MDNGQRIGLPEELRNGCVLYIPGDVSGTTAFDASGSGNNGTLVNSPTVTRGGLWGYKGLKFDGASQCVSIPSSSINSLLNNGGPFSIGFTFKTSSSALMGLVDTRITDQNGFFIQMNNGLFQVVRSDGSVADIANANGTWNDNAFHYAFTRYDSTGMYVSIDNNTEVYVASTRALNSSTEVNIGSVYNSNVRQYFFSGTIANLTINNSAFSKTYAELLSKAFFAP